MKLLEELFTVEGIFFDPCSIEELEEAYEDLASRTILLLQKAVEELMTANSEVRTCYELLHIHFEFY